MGVLSKQDRQSLFLVILKATFGNISAACDQVQISRNTYSNWMREEWFAEEVNDIREFVLDTTEQKLMENILANSSRDIHYKLDAQGRSRGYGRGPQVVDPDRQPQLASPNYPPEPDSLLDWERQVRETKKGRADRPSGPPRQLAEQAGPDGGG